MMHYSLKFIIGCFSLFTMLAHQLRYVNFAFNFNLFLSLSFYAIVVLKSF
jgi:hypothetical protein